MIDKEKRIAQIANRYTPPLAGAEMEALRTRFTTRPIPARRDPLMSFRLRVGPGTGYERLSHGQIIRTAPRLRMSRKRRLQQRRAERAQA